MPRYAAMIGVVSSTSRLFNTWRVQLVTTPWRKSRRNGYSWLELLKRLSVCIYKLPLLIWERYTNKFDNLALQNCRCELLHRFGLPCKHYLLRAFQQGQPIPRSLVHPRYWLRGPVIYSTNWRPTYVEDEAEVYDKLGRPEIRFIG